MSKYSDGLGGGRRSNYTQILLLLPYGSASSFIATRGVSRSAASLRPDAHDPPLILLVVRATPVRGVPVNAPTHVGYLFEISFILSDLYILVFLSFFFFFYISLLRRNSLKATPRFRFPENIPSRFPVRFDY